MTELRDKPKSDTRKQLIVKVAPKEHAEIKIAAARRGQTMREYVWSAVETKMREDEREPN